MTADLLIESARELRLALRALRRSPGVTLVAAFTMAIGVASTTGLFAVVRGVLLRPLPVREQDRVVVITARHIGRELAHYPFTEHAYRSVGERSATLDGVAAVDAWGSALRPMGGAESVAAVHAARVLGDFFGLLGVPAAAGRLLDEADDVPGGPRLAVISFGLWQRAFGGDRSAIGRNVTIAGVPYSILGVAAESFAFPRDTDVWTALRPHYADGEPPAQLELDLIGRVAGDFSNGAVRSDVAAILAADSALRVTYDDVAVEVETFSDAILGNLRITLPAAFAAAGFVLFVAGINLANLLLVRAADGRAALAVRRTLGARGGRLVANLVAQSLLIATAGAALGLVLAIAGIEVLLPLAPAGIPRLELVRVDATAFGFAAAATALVIIAFGVLPGAVVARREPLLVLRGVPFRGATKAATAHRTVIIAAQSALAILALVGAGLLMRTSRRLRSLDPGFAAEELVLVRFATPYPHFSVPDRFFADLETIRERLRQRPDVAAVTPALTAPLAGGGGFDAYPVREGQTIDAARDNPYLNLEIAAPDHFTTLGVAIRRGRGFEPGDDERAVPVIVLNQAAASALWPGRDPIGKRLNWPFPELETTWWTVVGVAADVRYRELLSHRPSVYFPIGQFRLFAPPYLIVRTRRTTDPAPLLPAVQDIFDQIDPALRVMEATPVVHLLAEPAVRPRFAAVLIAIFAAAATFLACVGVYGVVSHRVRLRFAEFGVRMSLGATRRDIVGLVFGRALRAAMLGTLAGLTISAVAARTLQSVLFGVTPADIPTFAVAVVIMAAVSAVACIVPALRAAAADPCQALRSE